MPSTTQSLKKKQLTISTSFRSGDAIDRSDMTTPIDVIQNAYTTKFSFWIPIPFNIFLSFFFLLFVVEIENGVRLHHSMMNLICHPKTECGESFIEFWTISLLFLKESARDGDEFNCSGRTRCLQASAAFEWPWKWESGEEASACESTPGGEQRSHCRYSSCCSRLIIRNREGASGIG